MPRRHRLWRYALSLPGSVAFCLRYLPLRQALRMPIFVSYTVARSRRGGKVRIEGPIRTGMITIGLGWAPLFDWRRSRGVWDVPGEVVFEGPAEILHGTKLSVAGRLVLGRNVFVNAESCISATREIVVGADTMIAWHTLIMDSDAHSIGGQDPGEPVSIGERVLIGARATVLKGARLPSGTIVAASSCVTRRLRIEECDLVAGNPARVVRSGVSWQR